MKDYLLLDNDAAMTRFTKSLRDRNIDTLAVDFEGEFSLHEHGERLCLVQVFDGKRFFLIDPFAITGSLLKDFLEDRTVLKLFFGAGSDVQLVFKERGIVLNSVLDVQLLAQTLGVEKLGLDSLLLDCLGIPADSRKKAFQMHNWTVRPISPQALDYALGDVAHLFALYFWLMKEIQRTGKWEELVRTLVLKTPSSISKGTPAWLKSKEYNMLGAQQRKVFEDIVAAREHVAIEMNWPPENVLARAQIARMASGQLGVDGIPRPKRMGESDYQKLKNRIREMTVAKRSAEGGTE